jgi:sulfite reductase beta subunit-like hemoprotein
MHAIQTSRQLHPQRDHGPFAGAADEIGGSAPWCEIIRQWSTLHPEFSFLPRKFKIAVTAAEQTAPPSGARHRPAADEEEPGETGFEVLVGGGIGRTPIIGLTVVRLRAEAGSAQLSRSHHARLQPLWPPRQQVQGAHQDPRERTWARRNTAARSRKNSRPECRWEEVSCRRKK